VTSIGAELGVVDEAMVDGFERPRGFGCVGLLLFDVVTLAFSNLDRREEMDPMDWISTLSDETSSFLPSAILELVQGVVYRCVFRRQLNATLR
jgi:hypothetical protein